MYEWGDSSSGWLWFSVTGDPGCLSSTVTQELIYKMIASVASCYLFNSMVKALQNVKLSVLGELVLGPHACF